jgi:hypothetical protein
VLLLQFGDRRAWDATLGNFGNFNEPYYRGYISTDLGEPLLVHCKGTTYVGSACEVLHC